jgi:hypothetical protein
LPDFSANQITRRNIDSSGTSQHWRLIESTDEELRYVDHKESYKVAKVNGKKVTNSDRGRPDGSTSLSDVSNLLSWIFGPKAQAEFKWNSWTTMHNRPTYVFAYKVPQERSQFTIGGSKKRVTAGFAGIMWVDRETNQVIRITATAQSPAGFSVQDVAFDVDCDFVSIGERRWVLPVTAGVRQREGKTFTWNEIEFRNYRLP